MFSRGMCKIWGQSVGGSNSPNEIIVKHGPEEHPTLSLRFYSPILKEDPIFECIQVLDLDCEGVVWAGLDEMLDDTQLSCLPNIDHLILREANWDADTEGLQELESWIVLRKNKGRLLRLI
jgi:hypothetical protein